MTSLARLFPALLFAACSAAPAQTLDGDGPAERIAHGGARLVAVEVTDAQDGAHRFLHFRDRETDQPCRLILIEREPDTYACLPDAIARTAYLDPECEGDPLPNLVHADDAWVRLGELFAPPAVRLGAPLEGVPLYTRGGHGACFPTTDVWSEAGTTYEAVERREAATFVTGTYAVDSTLDRIDRVTFTGSDGSTLLVALVDRLAQATCRPGEAPDGAGPRCIPAIERLYVGPETEELFLPGCERPIVASYGAPAVGYRSDDPDEVVHRYVRLDREIDVARRDPVSGACVVVGDFQLGRRTLYEVHEYPASAWPPVVLSPRGAPEASVEVAWSIEGEVIVAAPSPNPEAYFASTTLRADCAPGWVDDELRCVPVTPWVSGRELGAFEDLNCSRRALALLEGATPPTIAAFESGPATAAQAGLPSWEIHFVDPTPVGGWVLGYNGQCRRSDGFSLYRLANRAGADDLPRLMLRDVAAR